ncbi:MBL fold metallo-hydrolase [Cetobacterium sp.]|uniref:MBL fold metallo-hydrolase n=1 Tax=Cetobacterium sp. TaxID=2071632 RepID=UPI003F3F0CEE
MLKFIQIATIVGLTLSPFSTNTIMAAEPPANILAILNDSTPLVPTKVFDNLYCIGTKSVVAWALKTEDGIILIDSMWDDKDAQTIINGMEKLGLNPKEIKYIIVTHGHGDHYGGANYIRSKYNSKVVMTSVDENLMNTLNVGPNSPRSPKTPVDILVKDGDKITLGNTSVQIIETPGHTPGGLSVIFPVKNDGKEEIVAMWGGTGIPSSKEERLIYKKSVQKFEKEARKAGVTSEITAHLFIGDGYKNLDTVRARKAGEANLFVLDKTGIDKYFKELNESVDKLLK